MLIWKKWQAIIGNVAPLCNALVEGDLDCSNGYAGLRQLRQKTTIRESLLALGKRSHFLISRVALHLMEHPSQFPYLLPVVAEMLNTSRKAMPDKKVAMLLPIIEEALQQKKLANYAIGLAGAAGSYAERLVPSIMSYLNKQNKVSAINVAISIARIAPKNIDLRQFIDILKKQPTIKGSHNVDKKATEVCNHYHLCECICLALAACPAQSTSAVPTLMDIIERQTDTYGAVVLVGRDDEKQAMDLMLHMIKLHEMRVEEAQNQCKEIAAMALISIEEYMGSKTTIRAILNRKQAPHDILKLFALQIIAGEKSSQEFRVNLRNTLDKGPLFID